ncbi:MAG: VCBS repeat-containing protein [Bacteroidota bacterium]
MTLSKRITIVWLLGLTFYFLNGCSTPAEENAQAIFELHNADRTGLEFNNILEQDAHFNVFTYMYFYNGGGVAAGDFNNDGKTDLFFTSNMGLNKMFLNKGDFQFEDITEAAGIGGIDGWTTGCSVVDINNDGLLDLYVSQLGNFNIKKGQNQFYICREIENGIPLYEDQASDYGLDLVGFGTQAAFFDYDQDGDLDMYQLNHSVHQNGTFGKRKQFSEFHPTAGDRLLRNDSSDEGPKFTDVTQQAGIFSTAIGYGLGVVASDINLDGWTDIFVANDFHENDYFYINQKDGTFEEVFTSRMDHGSRFSMGVDIADINNDGHAEIITLDMMPKDPFILKSSLGEDGYSIFMFKLGHGYHPQFARNNLHLNDGKGQFSEIGIFADVHATDWSWAPLFLDFDHDGYRDLFVSNGIPRRMNDIDYINFKSDHEVKYKAEFNDMTESDLQYVEKMPQIKLKNKFLLNTTDLKFEDIGNQIINDQTSYSNGAVYADFDNDGDLDIVVNNIDDTPFLYENKTIQNQSKDQNYLMFDLSGAPENSLAIGAKVVVQKGMDHLVFENFPVRGYQSSVAPGIHIGVGDTADIKRAIVVWPDQTYAEITSLNYNSKTTLKWEEGLQRFDYSIFEDKDDSRLNLKEIASEIGLDYLHKENPFVEFDREPLIPHMVSSEGPALAVGDVNGDGLEDVFIGSSKRKHSVLFIQDATGKFTERSSDLMRNDSIFEDVDAVFADIENDGDLDLVVASGGNEYRTKEEPTRQRIYLNDGNGNFDEQIFFPGARLTASCVLPADFNDDGLLDFFIGARAEVWNYGEVPTSFLFKNLGSGQFEDVTSAVSDGLAKVGMVKNGHWSDIDMDGDQDLILAMEWDAIQLFENKKGKFSKRPLGKEKGWWNFVLPHDFDGDGDIDLIAGNLGQNTKFKPTADEPVRLYVNDFDSNGKIEQIVTYFVEGQEIPFANYAELTKQMVKLKKRYLYSKDLAAASVQEIFGKEKLTEAIYYEANYLSSAYYENTGNSQFEVQALPDELQFSLLNAASLADFNGDNKKEVLLGGNFFDANIELGWYDASPGHILAFGNDGQMEVSTLGDVRLKKQVKKIRPITINNKACYVVSRNRATLQVVCPSDFEL